MLYPGWNESCKKAVSTTQSLAAASDTNLQQLLSEIRIQNTLIGLQRPLLITGDLLRAWCLITVAADTKISTGKSRAILPT